MEPKPERLQQHDLEGLTLAYQSIAGIVAQLADIAQDSEPDDQLGATIQHLGSALRHLGIYVNATAYVMASERVTPKDDAETEALWRHNVRPEKLYVG